MSAAAFPARKRTEEEDSYLVSRVLKLGTFSPAAGKSVKEFAQVGRNFFLQIVSRKFYWYFSTRCPVPSEWAADCSTTNFARQFLGESVQLFSIPCVSIRDIMRPLAWIATLLGTTLCLGPSCRAQDASKIIDQYLKAAGGSKTLSKIQTYALDGTIRKASSDKPGTYTLRTKLPNRLYTEFRSEGQTFIEAYNGKSAWHVTDSGDIATLLGPQAV